MDESNTIVPQNHAVSAKPTSRHALRRFLMAQRQCMGASERQAREACLLLKVGAYINTYHANDRVALYMPHGGEPSLLGLLNSMSNPLCLPVVINKDEALKFAAWRAGEPLEEGKYGIYTPERHVFVRPQLLLIPCVGYTKEGFRLGYGGGYYDRTLKEMQVRQTNVTTVGIAWREAQCDIQPEAHDIGMNLLITA
jgi:5,10-methenyltetrahydrofolate synthetase